jgi:G3E family GTPase
MPVHSYATDPAQRLPVTILTGFLGAGKTTLLSHLIRQPELSNAAVIINEFGAVSLDHELVEKTDGDIVEVKGGCLCCTVRGDLVEALRGLMEKRADGKIKAFDRIVIETTGLADPAPILHTFMSDALAYDKFRLDGIVTVVDAVNGAATLDAHEEAVKQAAIADRILVSKSDLAEAQDLTSRLRALNPAAPILKIAHGKIAPTEILNLGPFDPAAKGEQVEAWLRAEATESHDPHHDHGHHGHEHHGHHPDHVHAAPDINRHDDKIRAFTFVRNTPVKIDSLQFLLQLLAMMRGPDLLRVKGIVNVEGEPNTPAVLHGVQHVFHPVTWLSQWPSADRRTRLVFIVRDITEQQIAELMDSLDDGDVADATTAARS